MVQFAKRPAHVGAGSVTITVGMSFISTVMESAAAVHGVIMPIKQLHLARIGPNRVSLVARSNERDRLPTQDKSDKIIAAAEDNPRTASTMNSRSVTG
jgi:hypothetical protein